MTTEPTLAEMEADLAAASPSFPWKHHPATDADSGAVETAFNSHLELLGDTANAQDILRLASKAPGATAKAIRLERENAALRAEVQELAKTALYEAMSDWSEEHYAAGWYGGCEHIIWRRVLEGKEPKLFRLATQADGWWAWSDRNESAAFVPLAEWEAQHGAVHHWSDCAVHNAPAYEPGPCDCGGFFPTLTEATPND